jgi:hypothetical protein
MGQVKVFTKEYGVPQCERPIVCSLIATTSSTFSPSFNIVHRITLGSFRNSEFRPCRVLGDASKFMNQ